MAAQGRAGHEVVARQAAGQDRAQGRAKILVAHQMKGGDARLGVFGVGLGLAVVEDGAVGVVDGPGGIVFRAEEAHPVIAVSHQLDAEEGHAHGQDHGQKDGDEGPSSESFHLLSLLPPVLPVVLRLGGSSSGQRGPSIRSSQLPGSRARPPSS